MRTALLVLVAVVGFIGLCAGNVAAQGIDGGMIIEVRPAGPADQPASQPEARRFVGGMRMQIGVVGVGGGVQAPATQPVGPLAPGQISVRQNDGMNSRMIEVKDGNCGTLIYTENAGTRHLVVGNPAGKTLFDGDVSTLDARKKIGDDVRAMVKNLKRHVHGRGGMRMVVEGGPGLIGPSDNRPGPLDDLVSEPSTDFTRAVGDCNVKVSLTGDQHRLVVTRDNTNVFDGPINNEADWARTKDLPADVVKAARSMDKDLSSDSTNKPDEN